MKHLHTPLLIGIALMASPAHGAPLAVPRVAGLTAISSASERQVALDQRGIAEVSRRLTSVLYPLAPTLTPWRAGRATAASNPPGSKPPSDGPITENS